MGALILAIMVWAIAIYLKRENRKSNAMRSAIINWEVSKQRLRSEERKQQSKIK